MKRCVLVLLISCLLVLGGCIEYQESLELYEDGTGQLSIMMGFDLSMMEMFSSDDDDEDMDMDMGLDFIENIPDMDGITVLLEESYEEDGWEWSKVVFSFDSLEHLRALNEIEIEEEDGSDFLGHLTWERGDDGYYIFNRELPLFGDDSDEEMDEMTIDMMLSFFGDVQFVYSVTFPRAVLETNTETESIDSSTNTVTWTFSLPDMVTGNQVMWAKIAR